MAREIEAGEVQRPCTEGPVCRVGPDVVLMCQFRLRWPLGGWVPAASDSCTGLSSGAVAVLDDGDGRRAARSLGIMHTGTAGIVAEGKRLGLIASAGDVLRSCKSLGCTFPPTLC